MNAGDALSISWTVSRMLGVHCAGALFCWMNASTSHASLVAAAMAVARHDSNRHKCLPFGTTKMISMNLSVETLTDNQRPIACFSFTQQTLSRELYLFAVFGM